MARDRRSPTPGALRKRDAILHLKGALDGGRFALEYQPVVGARDGRLEAVEALLRWQGEEAGEHTLEEALWSAERSPVIVRVEDWALTEACAAAAAWARAGLDGPRLHVNVSARALPHAHLPPRVIRRLEESGLEARRISLEITETSGTRDVSGAAAQLDRLSRMGIELWLDDFGTGHSSLEWLSRFPIDGLKIPRVFVAGLGREPRDATIVGRVIELAHDLGLRVIAEGVETEEQRDALVERGCDMLQGFLLHRPRPASEVPELRRV